MSSTIANAEPIATPINKKSLQTVSTASSTSSEAVVTPVATSSVSSAAKIMSTLDAMSCSPHDLGQFLLTQRFQGSTSSAIEFLRAVESTLLSSEGGQSFSPKGAVTGNDSTVEQEDFGPALTKNQEMSLVTPRAGKFQIALHQKGLLGYKTNSQAVKLVIPSGSVSHMIFFPKPEDCRKISKSKKTASADLVLLRFDPAISFQNKSITQLCLQLPFEKTQGALRPIPSDGNDVFDGNDLSEIWEQVMKKSLGKDNDTMVVARANNPSSARVVSTGAYQFSSYSDPNSSSTTSGMPFVKSYHGVNDGVLYPLQQGLLFFKPPHFIPRSLMHSIACGRGSSSSSRYVDMTVEMNDEDTDDHNSISFSNIQREEMGVLREYIHDILIPAMQQDASNSGGDGANAKASRESSEETQGETSDENSEDEDDDNYEVDSSDEEDKENDGSDDDEGEDTDDDEGGIEIVEDEMAQELAKKKRMEADNSATESEGEEEPIAKRRRRRIS